MSAIFTFSHQKGGVGKTTLALQFWGYFKAQGVRAALVDTDPQGSIRHLAKSLGANNDWENMPVFHAPTEEGLKALAKDENYDILIVDTPPYLTNQLAYIFQLSNVVVIPCKASPIDALAIEATVKLVRQALKTNTNLKAYVALNMVKSGTNFTNDIRDILATHQFPVLKNVVKDRIAYQRGLLFSPSVFDESDATARTEIENLVHEILDVAQS